METLEINVIEQQSKEIIFSTILPMNGYDYEAAQSYSDLFDYMKDLFKPTCIINIIVKAPNLDSLTYLALLEGVKDQLLRRGFGLVTVDYKNCEQPYIKTAFDNPVLKDFVNETIADQINFLTKGFK